MRYPARKAVFVNFSWRPVLELQRPHAVWKAFRTTHLTLDCRYPDRSGRVGPINIHGTSSGCSNRRSGVAPQRGSRAARERAYLWRTVQRHARFALGLDRVQRSNQSKCSRGLHAPHGAQALSLNGYIREEERSGPATAKKLGLAPHVAADQSRRCFRLERPYLRS